MSTDDFLSVLSGSLTDFYENILKKAGSGGRPVAMPLSCKFVTKAASLPAPDPAACVARDDNNVEEPQADTHAAAPGPPPAAAEAAAPPPAPPAPGGGGVAAKAVARPRLLD